MGQSNFLQNRQERAWRSAVSTEKHAPGKTKDNLRESSEDRGDTAAAKKDWWVIAPGYEKTVLRFPKKRIIFSQGELAEAVFYIQAGQVKLSVVSQAGKEAVVGILEPGAFFGETCLAGHQVNLATATALEHSTLVRVAKQAMKRLLYDDPAFSELFMTHLLSRNVRIQEDLADQLFNSAEKRLARVLLLLAHFGKDGKPKPVIPKINQETLAEMIGTTRSRVSFFMNKFRELGFVEYNEGLRVHSSLLNIVLHDEILHSFPVVKSCATGIQ